MSSIFGNSLRSPAPTLGAVSKGRIPASTVATRKRNLPTVQSLGNPSIRASVTDLQTNSTAAAPLFCKPFQKEWEKKYDEGDILFVKAEDVSVNSRNRFHTVANLPVLNQLLRTTRDIAPNGQRGPRTYRADSQGFRNLMEHWHFFGVMLNDMDTSSQFQRLLNVTVRGRCRLPNYWSHDAGRAFGPHGGNRDLKKGQVVWIGFIRTHVGDAPTDGAGNILSKDTGYQLDTPLQYEPDGARAYVQKTGSAVGEESYWQAIPVLEPSSDDNVVGKGGGNADFNRCVHKIPIAVIHHLPFKNQPLKRQVKARTVTDAGKLLDRMEVFVRI